MMPSLSENVAPPAENNFPLPNIQENNLNTSLQSASINQNANVVDSENNNSGLSLDIDQFLCSMSFSDFLNDNEIMQTVDIQQLSQAASACNHDSLIFGNDQ